MVYVLKRPRKIREIYTLEVNNLTHGLPSGYGIKSSAYYLCIIVSAHTPFSFYACADTNNAKFKRSFSQFFEGLNYAFFAVFRIRSDLAGSGSNNWKKRNRILDLGSGHFASEKVSSNKCVFQEMDAFSKYIINVLNSDSKLDGLNWVSEKKNFKMIPFEFQLTFEISRIRTSQNTQIQIRNTVFFLLRF